MHVKIITCTLYLQCNLQVHCTASQLKALCTKKKQVHVQYTADFDQIMLIEKSTPLHVNLITYKFMTINILYYMYLHVQ